MVFNKLQMWLSNCELCVVMNYGSGCGCVGILHGHPSVHPSVRPVCVLLCNYVIDGSVVVYFFRHKISLTSKIGRRHRVPLRAAAGGGGGQAVCIYGVSWIFNSQIRCSDLFLFYRLHLPQFTHGPSYIESRSSSSSSSSSRPIK